MADVMFTNVKVFDGGPDALSSLLFH